MQDPHHRKLGGHKGPWTEERPQAEMLDDFADFGDDCLALLKVGCVDPKSFPGGILTLCCVCRQLRSLPSGEFLPSHPSRRSSTSEWSSSATRRTQ